MLLKDKKMRRMEVSIHTEKVKADLKLGLSLTFPTLTKLLIA